MKTSLMMASALMLTLAGTGCATKKYVAKQVAPVEARVTTGETKNADQDKQLTDQGNKIGDQAKQIDGLGTDLSRTKERLTDTDAKAVAAGQSAQRANDAAQGAQTAANNARTFAETGIQQATQHADQRADQIEHTMDAMNKYKMLQSESVLFKVNQAKLDADAKAQLEAIAKMATGQTRYIIEVQGFTDKTGSAAANEALSQERAAAVTRFLVNEQSIPVRSINSIGSGYAMPVGDDKTRDGRKQNRRVEVRVFVPEAQSASSATSAAR